MGTIYYAGDQIGYFNLYKKNIVLFTGLDYTQTTSGNRTRANAFHGLDRPCICKVTHGCA